MTRAPEVAPRPRAGAFAWALTAVFAAAAIRFAPFLAGGTLYRRDAGFFFVSWRLVLARLFGSGEMPVWNEWMSAGRPFAADPNAAVFWPLSPLLLVLSPTALAGLAGPTTALADHEGFPAHANAFRGRGLG